MISKKLWENNIKRKHNGEQALLIKQGKTDRKCKHAFNSNSTLSVCAFDNKCFPILYNTFIVRYQEVLRNSHWHYLRYKKLLSRCKSSNLGKTSLYILIKVATPFHVSLRWIIWKGSVSVIMQMWKRLTPEDNIRQTRGQPEYFCLGLFSLLINLLIMFSVIDSISILSLPKGFNSKK